VLAKKALYGYATSIKPDYIPPYTECKGANRLHASTENLLTLLDANKAKLPQFFAANPIRLPSLTTTTASSNETVVAALASLVYELRDQVAALIANIDELRKQPVFTTLPAPQSSSQADTAHEVRKSR